MWTQHAVDFSWNDTLKKGIVDTLKQLVNKTDVQNFSSTEQNSFIEF